MVPGKPPDARNAHLLAPWLQAQGKQMIDPVRNSNPSHQRPQPDTPRYDKNEGFPVKRLQHAAQPTQKLVDAPLVAVAIEHALEEDGQFVNDEKHRLLLDCAVA